MKFQPPEPPEPTKQEQVAGLLGRFEAAEQAVAALRAKHGTVFAKLEELEEEKKNCLETVKRIMYTRTGPPDGSKKTTRPATGQLFYCEVVYKKQGDYYDPDLLPRDVLAKPGVVAEVNRGAIEHLDDPRCRKALKPGSWMTPCVSFKRVTTRDDEDM